MHYFNMLRDTTKIEPVGQKCTCSTYLITHSVTNGIVTKNT